MYISIVCICVKELENINSQLFESLRGENNQLFQQVHNPREAINDAQNLRQLAALTRRQVYILYSII